MTRRYVLNKSGDRLAVDDDGTTLTPCVVVTSMPAITVDPPIGGATSAKQDTGNTSIASVDGKLPALVGGRIPVVLPAGGSGLTDAELRASAVPVSGTFYPATQPVSGTFWQSVQPVSGTFWQSVQPVSASALPLPSGASTEATLALIKAKTDNLDVALSTRAVTGLTDAQLRAAALPVSGTFWQATQPVSLAASVAVTGTFWQATQPVSGPLTDTQIRATALPISAAYLPLPSGATTSAKQDTIIAALPATLGQKTMAASLAVALASDQGSVPVQVKDSGRVRFTATFQAVATATADTMLSLVKNLGGVVSTGATSIGVTAGKRLRITHVTFSVKAGAAAAAFATLTLRSLSNGPTLIGSPVLDRVDLGNTAATIGAADKIAIDYPEGLEFSGTETLGASLAAQAVTNVISVAICGYEYTP